MSRSATDELWVTRLGQVPYADAEQIQHRLRTARQAGELPDVLLLLEHPPVYTLGRRGDDSDLPMGESWYLGQGIDVQRSDRGGRLTYHGPGQLVGYPIMGVTDIPAYVRGLEDAMIAALGDEGVRARVREGLTGVWAEHGKIGAIGIHVSRGVTTHGFAVNVDNDLQPFQWVVACGGEGTQATSVLREKNAKDPASVPDPSSRGTGGIDCFSKRVAWRVAQQFGRRQRLVSAARLGLTPKLVTA